jgi:hypothetical protein
MHLDLFSPGEASDGIKCFAAEHSKPSILNKMVIVVGVNECELALGEGDLAGGFMASLGKLARIEIGATRIQIETAVPAGVATPVLAYQNRPVNTDYPSGKRTVVATDFIFYFSHRLHRLHRFIKNKAQGIKIKN